MGLIPPGSRKIKRFQRIKLAFNSLEPLMVLHVFVMTQSSTPTISQAKARANEKLFGKKDAPSLKINLINHIRQFD